MSTISSTEHKKQFIEVDGKRMAYVEMGSGSPIIFQHGNPSSSYLWRNIMPTLAQHGRCIAVDLIGMGDSDKLKNSNAERYTFAEHQHYLDGAWAQLGVTKHVTLVIHDWGSALGFHWANRHRQAIRGIAYMEAIVQPLSWSQWPQAATDIFRSLRSKAGEKMVLENNVFVERILPGSILRPLTEAEMTVYRRPYLKAGESRRPTLTWPRQIPLDGEPDQVKQIVQDYADWLQTSELPKLFVNAEPGAILTGKQREFCRSWPNTTEVTVSGNHFLQEDSPDDIAAAIAAWLKKIGQPV